MFDQKELLNKKWFLIIFFSLLSVTPRFFYLNVPFERDEGVYAYTAQIIGDGGLPYKNSFDHKPPLIHYIYFLSFKLFGYNIAAPRITAIFFMLIASILTFALTQEITNSFFASIIAMLFLGLSTSSPAYTGFNTNTEIFTIPFTVGGLLFLIWSSKTPVFYFLSGVSFGIGFMIKQPMITIAVIAFIPAIVNIHRDRYKSYVSFLFYPLGFITPFLVFIFYFISCGILDFFLSDAFYYNFNYIRGPSFADAFFFLKTRMLNILKLDAILWICGSIGIFVFCFSNSDKSYKVNFLMALIGSGLSVAMGGYFYSHYFLFFVPFLSIGVGLGVGKLINTKSHSIVVFSSMLILIIYIFFNFPYFLMSKKDILEKSYGALMPFNQSQKLGNYLKSIVHNKTAFIIGSEPEIYFYANLKSPTRFSYFYPLMQKSKTVQRYREELLKDLKSNMPDYLIFVCNFTSHFITGTKIHYDKFLESLFYLFSSYGLSMVSNYDVDYVIKDGINDFDNNFLLNSKNILIFERSFGNLRGKIPFGLLFNLGFDNYSESYDKKDR